MTITVRTFLLSVTLFLGATVGGIVLLVRGSDTLVEVFDPSAAKAHSLG